MFKIKRVYEKFEKTDGIRILVDRLWPRGLNKQKAKIDFWMKEISPSNNLRNRFSHRPERWEEFRQRYFKELKSKKELIRQFENLEEKNKMITLVYAAKDEQRNNAIVLLEFLKGRFDDD